MKNIVDRFISYTLIDTTSAEGTDVCPSNPNEFILARQLADEGKLMFGTIDTCATHANIEKIYRAMKKAVEEEYAEYKVRFISHSSHWYDWGAMNYSRFIIDAPPGDAHEQVLLHNRVWNTGVRAAIANGGVVNDHHGVGLKLSRLMKDAYGPAMQVFEGLKKALDPNGIMNPYKMGL